MISTIFSGTLAKSKFLSAERYSTWELSTGKLITIIFSLIESENLTGPSCLSNSCLIFTRRASSIKSISSSFGSSSDFSPWRRPPATSLPFSSIIPANLILSSRSSTFLHNVSKSTKLPCDKNNLPNLDDRQL